MTGEDRRLRFFLSMLCDPERKPIDASQIAVVVAHPDDETIGCGALLGRMGGVRLIVITDGAPPDAADAVVHGFSTSAEYASARTRELRQAIALAGIAPENLFQLNIPDQQSVLSLRRILYLLADLFTSHGIDIVLTQAYEGGHPDHDAAAFCVNLAAHLCGRPISVVEMPYYRATETGETRQTFWPVRGTDLIAVALHPMEMERKRQMLEAYETQRQVLSGFSIDKEQFRIAPNYDFTVLPNDGRLLYERQNWGVTGDKWLRCIRAAIEDCAVAS
jgi:LmbE family N-acetylglucosaminyl deacetylase